MRFVEEALPLIGADDRKKLAQRLQAAAEKLLFAENEGSEMRQTIAARRIRGLVALSKTLTEPPGSNKLPKL